MKLLVFLFILVNSLIFTFAVPPFQKPDEDAKFFRTVALSRGQFFCYRNNKGEKVISIPRKYFELPQLFKVDELKFNSDRKLFLNISEIRNQFNKFGDDEIETSKGCISYWLGFIPNTVGFLIGATFADPLVQFYFGRITGLILFISVFWYSLKIIPRPFHLILYLYGALSMVIHQVTAFNEDVVFLSIIPLVFSHFIKIFSVKIITLKELLFYQISVQLLLLSKPIAVPFIFLHLLLPEYIIYAKNRKFWITSIIFFFLSILLGLYFYYLKR